MGLGELTTVVPAILNLIATIFVILRVISRSQILKKTYVDDYLVVCGLILSWCLIGLILAAVHFDLGQHQDQVTPQTLYKQFFCLYLYVPIYKITLSVIKLSALFQFLRFFPTPETRLAAWVLIIIVAAFGLAMSIGGICACIPLDAFWILPKPGKCIDLTIFWYFNSSFNVATDIAVVALPVYVLKDLRIPERQKWAVIGVFVVGVLTCVTSIIRLYTIDKFIKEVDSSYYNAPPTMWSSIEAATAITCACMQSLKPLVQKLLPHWLGQRDSSSGTTLSGGSVWKLSSLRKTTYIGDDTADRENFPSDELLLNAQNPHTDRKL